MPLPTKENVSRPLAAGYDVLIEYGDTDAESLYLRAAVGPGRQLAFQTVEPQAKGPSTVENPEDMRSVSGETFSRSDFSGGFGLRFAHRRNQTDFDFSRFWRAEGVDTTPSPTGYPPPLSLLHSMSVVRSSDSETVEHRSVCVAEGVLYAALGAEDRKIDRTADPTAETPTWTQEDTDVGDTTDDITDLVAHDGTVYVSLGVDGHVHRRKADGSWEHWSDLETRRMWSVKGRILAESTTGGLYEAAAGSGSVLIHGGDDEGEFGQVADGGSVVLVAHRTRGILHYADEDGELVLVGSTSMPDGEEVLAVGGAFSVVLVVTGTRQDASTDWNYKTMRIWRGIVVGTRITNIQLLHMWEPPIPSVAPNRTVRSAEVVATRDAMWYPALETNSAGNVVYAVYRYDLGTGSLHRHVEVPQDADGEAPTGFAVVDGKVFLKANDDDLYREDDSYVDKGFLITPLADFYNDDTKTWVDVRMRIGQSSTQANATLYYTTDPAALDDPDSDSWKVMVAAGGAAGEFGQRLQDVESRWLAIKVELWTLDSSETPTVHSVAARALLKPSEQDWQIPINVSDRLEMPHRKPLLIPGLGERVREALESLVGKAVTVTLLRPSETVVGQITGLSVPIQELPERGSPSVYALLTIRGEKQE